MNETEMVDNIWTEFAICYDQVIPELNCYQRMVDKILRDTQAARTIIDAGCGTGIVSELLVRRDQSVYGFDNNLGMLHLAEKKQESLLFDAQTASFQPENWVIGRASLPEFPEDCPNQVDAIVLNNVLFYLPECSELLKKCRQYLSSDGVIIITGPKHRPDSEMVHRESMKEWEAEEKDLQLLLPAIQKLAELYGKLTTDENEMVSFFQPEELVSLLTQAGFKKVIEASGEDYYGENFYVSMSCS